MSKSPQPQHHTHHQHHQPQTQSLRTLEVCVNPWRSLGAFRIGLPLNTAIAYLTHEFETYPHVDLVYNNENPLLNDIVLRLTLQGIQLRFDPVTQQLKAIELYDFRTAVLQYSNKPFSSPQSPCTFSTVYHAFGPTRGYAEAEKGRYLLAYPGLVFVFPLRESGGRGRGSSLSHSHASAHTNASQSAHTSSTATSIDLIDELAAPNGYNPQPTNLIIFHGESFESPKAPPLELTRDLPSPLAHAHAHTSSHTHPHSHAHSHPGSVCTGCVPGSAPSSLHTCMQHTLPPSWYFQRVEVLPPPRAGVILHSMQRQVLLGDTPQRVIAQLGPPAEIYFKAEDKMRIHKMDLSPRTALPGADFFFNYFHLGLDVLFDAGTLRVKKVVLHSNYPGHFDFTRYARCNFLIRILAPFPASSNGMNRLVPPPMSSSVISAQPGALESMQEFLQDMRTSSGIHTHDSVLTGTEAMEESVDLRDGPSIPLDDPKTGRSSQAFEVTPETKWEDVQSFLGSVCGQPVVFSRPPAPNASNPFGSTVFYAWENCVYEVLPSGNIATVVVCDEQEA